MKKIGVWIWGCLLGGMVAACGGRNGAHGEEPDFTGLDSLIQGWVDKGYYPGAAICVKQDTAVLFRKSYGAVSPDTPVYVASAGKWVAAAVVAAVVDRTELSWDDPVEKWLPEFKGDPKGVIPLRLWTPYSRPERGSSMAVWPCRWPDAWPRWLRGRSLKLCFRSFWPGPYT